MKFNSRGQTIIEVLAALTAATIIVAAMTIAVITALNNAQYSKNQNLATQYAQEGMEIIRKLRDSDPAGFVTTYSDGHYCLGSNAVPSKNPSCAQNIGSIFKREFDLTRSADCKPDLDPNPDQIKVTMHTKWSDSKCSLANPYCNEAKLTSCFPDINPVPTP